MTAQERLVMLCSGLGLSLSFTYNSQTKQFEAAIDSGSGHYRGSNTRLEAACKVILTDIKKTVDVSLDEFKPSDFAIHPIDDTVRHE